MKKVFLGAMLAVAVTAFAQKDECNIHEVTPLLIRADSVKKVGGNELTETRKEKSGTYTVSQGGCDHYGVIFEFENIAARKGESPLKEAARLLRGVKLKSDKQYIRADLITLLEKNAGSPYTAGDTLPNPDHPDINVSVEEETTGKKRIVKVVYSQVL
jgi:hypothetical protein